jgi:hypothetical protein
MTLGVHTRFFKTILRFTTSHTVQPYDDAQRMSLDEQKCRHDCTGRVVLGTDQNIRTLTIRLRQMWSELSFAQ